MKINIKKISINIILMLIGLLFTAFGIAICYSAGLGSSPIATIGDGFHNAFNISYGMGSLASNLSFLLILVFSGRKQISWGTLVIVLFMGVFIDFAGKMLVGINIDSLNLFVKIIITIIGTIITAFGIGLFVSLDVGKGPVEGVSFVLQEKTKIQYKYLRPIMDLVITIIGFILGAKIGIGTLISIILTGYIMQITMEKLSFLPDWKNKLN